MCPSFPFGIEGMMWDVFVLLNDHCHCIYLCLLMPNSVTVNNFASPLIGRASGSVRTQHKASRVILVGRG